MGAGKYVAPDYAGGQSGTVYPASLDKAAAIMRRIAGAFNPSAQDTPNMTVLLDAGSLLNGTALSEVAAQSTATIVAPVTNPRIDRVVINSTTGVVSVIGGTEAVSPVAPAITAGNLPICQVALATTTTQITDSLITDERQLVPSFDDTTVMHLAGTETITGLKTFSANLIAQALVDISAAGAGQIKFPATQNASADVNTLDDYEEGTWTPSLGGTTTYTTQVGKYIKIGGMVFLAMDLIILVQGTGSAITVSGLPFTVGSSNQSIAIGISSSLATAIVSVTALLVTGTTTIQFRSRTAANASDTTNSIFQANANVRASGTYFV